MSAHDSVPARLVNSLPKRVSFFVEVGCGGAQNGGMKFSKYSALILAGAAALCGSSLLGAAKQVPDWKKRLPAVHAQFRIDCSKLEARPMSLADRKMVVYQMFLRMFTPEGTIKAAEKMLPHLKELGVDVIYTCPIVLADDDTDPNFWSERQKVLGNPKSPYRLKDYFEIDPEYGTKDDVKRFVAAAHKYGMRVMFDLVYYHCGPKAKMIGVDKDFVRRDKDGNIINGRWDFPANNFDNPKLREYLWSNMEYLVREFDIDGFRNDVEYYIPLDFWEEGARRVRKIKPGFLMLAEGLRTRCQLEAYDINYSWRFIRSAQKVYRDGMPATEIIKAENFIKSLFPKNARWIRALENHDEALDFGMKRPDMAWPDGAYESELFVAFTLDGIPMIYNGVEIADNAPHSIFSNRDFGKMNINWSMALTSKGKARFAFLQKLADLRKTLPALVMEWAKFLDNTAPDSVLSFARTAENQKLVSVANTKNAAVDVEIDVSSLGANNIFTAHICRGAEWKMEGGKLKVLLQPYGFALLELQ